MTRNKLGSCMSVSVPQRNMVRKKPGGRVQCAPGKYEGNKLGDCLSVSVPQGITKGTNQEAESQCSPQGNMTRNKPGG